MENQKKNLTGAGLSPCSEQKGKPKIANHVWSLRELLAL
jgi:hypothetical protein